MLPTLRSRDVLLIRLGGARAKVDDLVVVRWPGSPLAVKRLLSVEPDGSWWVVRDSASAGIDSFSHGAVPPAGQWGVVLTRCWPLRRPAGRRRAT